ncbi:MAG: EAL domain-containing protein [Rhizobiaceae bacterium]|nr:EAL domain-containing protein [Rhizobiaceae bacterium]
MLNIINCIVYDHDYRGLALAVTVCVLGSLVATRLFGRVSRTAGSRRILWMFLSSVVCGAVIWTTHFLAMLGYRPGIEHAYEPIGTLISLLLPIGFTLVGLGIASTTHKGWQIEAGGAVLGLGIAVMHYTGMMAFRVAGRVEFDPTLVVASVIFGALFGALTFNRIARPVTRFCKYGSSAALILGIASMHFTAMGAVAIIPDPSVVVPAGMVSSTILVAGVVTVMALILMTSISAYMIDLQRDAETVQNLRRMALHDAVTGLPNRAHLATRLPEYLADAAKGSQLVAVVAIDLDRFKDVNDVHGHATGDMMLRRVAERLSTFIGKNNFVARVGGDEFVAVSDSIYSREQARTFAEKIYELINEPVEHDGRILTVGASLGISLYPDDGLTQDELTGRADLAMYRAKQSAADKICFYEASMDENSRRKSALALQLRYAVEREELELYYQPQFDVATRELVGFEALVRWNHPENGLVMPGDFIPIAEETGLIIPIGEWVLKTACREAVGWEPPYKVAVNVASAQILQSNLPQIVHQILLETGLSPSRLELEITESSIISDQQNALHVIRQLKSMGVMIAMDDYGTGYSSLSTLQAFPFDKIKIDRSFISDLGTSEQAGAIVRSTIILADSLKIPVLAEGVESETHMEFLTNQGCEEAQGYLFSKPMQVADVHRAISEVGRTRLKSKRGGNEPTADLRKIA